MSRQRLQKVLAEAGVASRRKCEQLILDGQVRVNRQVVDKLPVFVDAEKDSITVDGRKIRPAKKVYYLFNKPKGVVCTNSDPGGRKKAIDMIPSGERIFCAGRLDMDSTGLIILTNDNELTNVLTHPRYVLSKSYVATVDGKIDSGQVERLKKGVWLAEGKTAGSAVKIVHNSYKQSVLEITIRQGLNRQVRRMLAKVGLKVRLLKRTQIGKLTIRGLGEGKYRHLAQPEVAYLNGIKKQK
ncbi:MAG TPA: pseudouridine synthase [Sedimentisphaerales bacterium]|nr:pseudouridine synthase [Sedimentisphaerales bacterium]